MRWLRRSALTLVPVLLLSVLVTIAERSPGPVADANQSSVPTFVISPERGENASPAISRNGRFIAYSRADTANGLPSVSLRYDTTTGETLELPWTTGIPTSVSDNGNVIAFASYDGPGFLGYVDSGSQTLLIDPECTEDVNPRFLWSTDGDVSADGRFVVFTTSCVNEYDNWAAETLQRVFYRDTLTGEERVLREGEDLAHTCPNSPGNPNIDASGYVVAFGAPIGDDGCRYGTVVLDFAAGTTEEIQLPGTNPSQFSSLSDDGRYVLATTAGDDPSQLYVYDRVLDTTTLVSANPSGQPGNRWSGAGKIAGDAETVFFQSFATDLTDDGPTSVTRYFARNLRTRETLLVGNVGRYQFGQLFDLDRGGRYAVFNRVLNPDDESAGTEIVVADLKPGLPDLQVTAVEWSPKASPSGQAVVFSATIKNAGNGWTPSDVIHGVAFAVNGTVVTWSDTSVASLPPGATRVVTANGSPTGRGYWRSTSGLLSVRAVVDDVDRIPEGNEANNGVRLPMLVGNKAVLLVGSSSLQPSDQALASRLQALGKDVTVIDDDQYGQAPPSSLVVVSSSVDPAKVPTSLALASVPLLNAEAFAQTRLRMATSGAETAAQTKLRIANAAHPLAAGLSGDVSVQTSTAMGSATPPSSATVVARIPGATSASVFGIEQGAALTSGKSPARRVGFFFAFDSPQKLTASGWALFDAAVRWLGATSASLTPVVTGGPTTTTSTTSTSTTSTSTTSSSSTTTSTSTTSTTATPTTTSTVPAPNTVVLLAGSSPGPANDSAFVTRLQGLGKQVVVVDDDVVTPESLTGASMVVISSSVAPTKVPAWLATQAIPVLNTEAYAQTTLKMASAGSEVAAQTTIRVVNAGHPLAAGKTGDLAVQTSAPIGAGTPATGAVVIARIPAATSSSLYGIETGAALTSGTAPARRVGFFFSYDSPPKATANGWGFFDAAVRWLAPAA